MKPVYLLTGRPGTGKTSLIKQVVAVSRLRSGGFYTEEIRAGGKRLGFRLVTLGGRAAVLAHVDFTGRFRVGKYGVDIAALEDTGVPALLAAAAQDDLIIVDEIGKMELLSPAFRESITGIIGSGKKVLGTIMLNPDPFADNVKLHPNVTLTTLTRDNYQSVLDELQKWLKR